MKKLDLNDPALPLISVIVPVYNAAALLPHCVETIRAQTYRNLEIVLCDDGSDDGETPVVCDRLAAEDPRIRVIHKANTGVSATRNAALDAAAGAWIGFSDSDDEMPPRAVELLYAAATENGTAMAMGAYDECHPAFGDKGQLVRHVPAKPAVLRTAAEAQRYFVTDGQFLNHMWTKLFRRDLFDHVRFPEGIIYEDIAVIPYLLEAGGSCTVINRTVYRYQVRRGSLSTGTDIRVQMDGLRVRRQYAEFVGERYPELLPLAYDAILPVACNVLGKIEHIGRGAAQEEWDETIDLVRDILPKCALQNPLYKAGSWVFRRRPEIISRLTHFLLVADKMI